MTQDERPQDEQPQEDLKDQFRNLGENLKNVLNSAWESQERKNLQKDIQDGLNEVGEIVEGLMVSFRDSEAGQKFMAGMDDLSEKYQSGEMQETADLMGVGTERRTGEFADRQHDAKRDNRQPNPAHWLSLGYPKRKGSVRND